MNDQVTRNGRQFTIRRPVESDAEALINYSKLLFASTDQVLTMLEEYTITVEQEKGWINSFNRQPNAIVLVAEIEKRVVGLLFFTPGSKKKNAHAGEFGVNVHPGFQRIGIGRLLIEELLKWARDNKTIEKVCLQVFETNHSAIRLYRKLGFIEEGRLVKAIKQPAGQYVDILQMYIETK